MRVIKNILLFPFYLIKITLDGAVYVCILTTKGFYSYFVWGIRFLKKIFHIQALNNLERHFKKRMNQPECFLFTLFGLVCLFSFLNILLLEKIYIFDRNPNREVLSNKNITFVDDSYNKEDLDVFKKYEGYSLNKVSIRRLKSTNKETVCWLRVSNTRINYPIVKTDNNNFYFENNYDKHSSNTGWPFMDYRNSSKMKDDNTVFYGKSLTYGISFGDLGKLLNEKKFDIVILTNKRKYTYKVFSSYKNSFNKYSLISNFTSDIEKEEFFEDIKNKSVLNFNVDVDSNDRIITLTTNSSDNMWIVIHAVLVNDERI